MVFNFDCTECTKCCGPNCCCIRQGIFCWGMGWNWCPIEYWECCYTCWCCWCCGDDGCCEGFCDGHCCEECCVKRRERRDRLRREREEGTEQVMTVQPVPAANDNYWKTVRRL